MSTSLGSAVGAALGLMLALAAAQEPERVIVPEPLQDAVPLPESRPAPGPDPQQFVRAISERFASASQYCGDLSIELAHKSGQDARATVASFKTKIAIAPGGKYLLWVGDQQSLEYLVVSDGKIMWAFMPESNKYVVFDAVVAPIQDVDWVFASGVTDANHDPVLATSLIAPILANMARNVGLADMSRVADAGVNEHARSLPVLSVLSKQTDGVGQYLTETAFDPDTLTPLTLEWTRSITQGDDKQFVQLSVRFENLHVGDPVPHSYFAFNPGNAERVQQLAVPGIDGSALVDKVAPDFDVEFAGRSKSRLSTLKGRPALIAFSCAECVPCREQASALQNLEREFGNRLVVIHAGPELSAAYDRYGIRFFPTVVVVNAEGKVAGFAAGRQDDAALRLLLKKAGL